MVRVSHAPCGLGQALRETRIARGVSLEAMARRLHWTIELLEAMEGEAWSKVPPGQERPMVRQMAEQLDFPLEAWQEAWNLLPGGEAQEPLDPRRLLVERILTVAMAVGSVAMLAWLVIPGRNLHSQAAPTRPTLSRAPATTTAAPSNPKPFPVLGEALPESPVTDEGILVTLRAMDVCRVRILGPTPPLEQTVRVSEPWRVRVKGPFTLELENAGVVVVDVAGRRIRHGQEVGDAWSGAFDVLGNWVLPPRPAPKEASPIDLAEDIRS